MSEGRSDLKELTDYLDWEGFVELPLREENRRFFEKEKAASREV
jgi:hypothetical protein